MNSRTRAWTIVCVALLVILGWPSWPEAAPIKVRLAEGTARGFLVLRGMDGKTLAHGELVQNPAGGLIENRLTLNFADGSLYDERLTFSQKDVFRLESYKLVQRGPSFPTSEVSFDRKTGRYQARVQDKKGDEVKEASGEMEMPDDLYNGMALTLIKNSGAGTSTRIVAFTPKPRLVTMEFSHEGDDPVRVGGLAKTARRHLVKLEIGGLTGLVASAIGKEPPDLRYWLMAGDIPAFVKFEGAMYLNGPPWRIEQARIDWPK